MIHARSKEELDSLIEELSALMNGCKHKIMNTVKEFKKTSFSPENKKQLTSRLGFSIIKTVKK